MVLASICIIQWHQVLINFKSRGYTVVNSENLQKATNTLHCAKEKWCYVLDGRHHHMKQNSKIFVATYRALFPFQVLCCARPCIGSTPLLPQIHLPWLVTAVMVSNFVLKGCNALQHDIT